MTEEQIKDLILKEIQEKSLGVTEQYLDIHEPVLEGLFLKIVRIDRNSECTVAYVPVKGEHFLFEFFINEKDNEVYSMGTLARNMTSLIATSESLSAEELSLLTKLKVTKHWNKGDSRFKNKIAKPKFSGIVIEPDQEPGEFEEKLKNLLDYIRQDKDGIRTLLDKADAYIDVVVDFHRGNQHIGTQYIDA